MPTLNWIGKEAVVKHHKDVPFRLLEPVAELSCGDNHGKDSGNLIVQGDNLHALKALLPRYAGQVKCIYIDPPYNTGNEGWKYNDNVNSPEIRKWLGEVVGKEGETLDRHDRWLSMMYPRLLLLKKFLRDDGLIFVSIDDNEQQSLRWLMDEIFQKDNFVAQFVWNTEGHTDNQFHVKVNHEYVVCYALNAGKATFGHVVDPNTREESNLWAGFAENSITKNGPANPPSEIELPVGFPISVESIDLPPSEVPDGLIRAMMDEGLSSNPLKRRFGKIQFPLRFDRMVGAKGVLSEPCRVFSGWANANKLRRFIDNDCEPLEDDGSQLRFYLSESGVIYYRRERGDKARNILSVLRGFSTTEKMRAELERMNLHFSYPKPKELIKYLVKVGSEVGDIVLDSFAGSGTTGQAVMELSSEGESRNFILVEISQATARDITHARLKKISNGYLDSAGEHIAGLGGGFQFCQLSAEPLFDASGQIRSDVKFAQLAEFVWFAETGTGYTGQADSPLLGVHEGRAIYLLYNGILKDKSVAGGNVLTGPVLDLLPKFDGPKVIYAAANRLGARAAREGITFKQTPYALEV
jgi:DNA modification methylase